MRYPTATPPAKIIIGLLIVAGLIALDTFYGANFDLSVSERNSYAGAAKCAQCHKDINADYAQSGHPLKIQKTDGKPPSYPMDTSPGVPEPPKGIAWADISYVIGGYGWKARFMDSEGFILTGKQNRQYNIANANLDLPGGWSGYDARTAPRKPYTCGSCHTTGWTKTGADGPHQDGLPGIHGTWKEAGVTCEACHGPAAAHVQNPTREELSIEPNCKSCHVRGDVKKIDAGGGLVRHHEQYEDLLASPHRNLGCLACHDPHKSAKYRRDGFKGEQVTCLKCHESEARVVTAPKAHNACIACHMPFAGKSAVAIKIAYKGGVLPMGDIRSHIHRINTDPTWNMFTDDGKFVRTDDWGRAYLSLDRACLGCHVLKDKGWAARNAVRIHGDR